MIRRLLQPIRFALIFLSILIFMMMAAVVWPFIRERWRRTYVGTRILTWSAKRTLWILGIKVHPIGWENLKNTPGSLFVGNHLSYLDVLVISSQIPTCFVTSREIKETPFLGQICQMAGCLFVERRNKNGIRREINEIRTGLSKGLNVTIFPEATSTNGESILRFRAPLFLAAAQSQQAVVPVCLNYRNVGGKPLSLANRDFVFWYGDMAFAPHLWALCGVGSIDADLVVLRPISTVENHDPTQLAALSQAAVESAFHSVPLDESAQ